MRSCQPINVSEASHATWRTPCQCFILSAGNHHTLTSGTTVAGRRTPQKTPDQRITGGLLERFHRLAAARVIRSAASMKALCFVHTAAFAGQTVCVTDLLDTNGHFAFLLGYRKSPCACCRTIGSYCMSAGSSPPTADKGVGPPKTPAVRPRLHLADEQKRMARDVTGAPPPLAGIHHGGVAIKVEVPVWSIPPRLNQSSISWLARAALRRAVDRVDNAVLSREGFARLR